MFGSPFITEDWNLILMWNLIFSKSRQLIQSRFGPECFVTGCGGPIFIVIFPWEGTLAAASGRWKKGEMTLPSAACWWNIPACAPPSEWIRSCKALSWTPCCMDWVSDAYGRLLSQYPEAIYVFWVKPTSRICPLVSTRDVLVQIPKCGWRMPREEKGLDQEIPKGAGGCCRAPGMERGLR